MVLQGYQFDRMAVTPDADSLLFHVLNRRNNTVIDGYKNGLAVTSSGLNVIVSTGAAVIYGRLITNINEERISVQANKSGYVVLTVDLTAVNTSTGVPGTIDYRTVNNQIRLEVVDTLNQQNLFNGGFIHTFPLARYVSTGSSITLTKTETSYYQDDTGWIRMQTAGVVVVRPMEVRRIGKLVQFRGSGILQSTVDQIFYIVPPEIGSPSADSRFKLAVETSATNVKCLVYVRPDRNFRIQYNNAGSNTVSFDGVSYFID